MVLRRPAGQCTLHDLELARPVKALAQVVVEELVTGGTGVLRRVKRNLVEAVVRFGCGRVRGVGPNCVMLRGLNDFVDIFELVFLREVL